MMDLAPTELAFRVGVVAGVLGALGWLPFNMQLLGAVVLLILAAIYFYEIWVTRGVRRKQRAAAVWVLLWLGSATALYMGWVAAISTPLLALAGVCIALWAAGSLGDNGSGDAESETEH